MNTKYFIVDCHLHGVFRNPEEGWKARATELHYDLLGGTLDEIIRYMDELGIGQAWCMPAWPTYGLKVRAESRLPKDLSPSERKKAEEDIRESIKGKLERFNLSNCMAAKSYPDRLAAFITVDPYFGGDWMVKELEDKFANGAKGVKLLPDWNHYYPNDRVMWPVYEKMEELGLVLLVHSGWSGGTLWDRDETASKGYTWPVNYADVLKDFPKLNVVLAHLGERGEGKGWELPEAHLELAQRFPNAYFDISGTQEIRFDRVELIRQIGADRVLWGSDWSAHRHSMSLVTLLRSNLSNGEKRKILGGNAQRLIKL